MTDKERERFAKRCRRDYAIRWRIFAILDLGHYALTTIERLIAVSFDAWRRGLDDEHDEVAAAVERQVDGIGSSGSVQN